MLQARPPSALRSLKVKARSQPWAGLAFADRAAAAEMVFLAVLADGADNDLLRALASTFHVRTPTRPGRQNSGESIKTNRCVPMP